MVDDELNFILQQFPSLMEHLQNQMELIVGKTAKSGLSNKELISIKQQLKKIFKILKQIEAIQEETLTPDSARKMLFLLNNFYRLYLHRIPKDQEPIDYLIETLETLREIPSNQNIPLGSDISLKFKGLRSFIDKLLRIVPESKASQFLNEGITENQILAQLQRAVNNLSMPLTLKEPPRELTIRTCEKLKLALHDVITDWEGLTNVIYGLIIIMDGQTPTWKGIREIPLRVRVEKINKDPNLSRLVKPDWVTVRNAIAHGKAVFIPSEKMIKFPDRNKLILWTLPGCYIEAVDIFLANQTMLSTWNIVDTFGLGDFKKKITNLKKLATQ